MTRSGPARFGACALLLALAACNGGTASPPSLNTGPSNFAIIAGGSMNMEAMQALRFYPSAFTVNVGDTVTWKFPAGEPHTVTFLGPRPAAPPPKDPSASAPAGGTMYDGSTYTSSGFQLLGRRLRRDVHEARDLPFPVLDPRRDDGDDHRTTRRGRLTRPAIPRGSRALQARSRPISRSVPAPSPNFRTPPAARIS